MQGVVLAEEFARAKAPMRADFFGDTLVGPTHPAVGHRGAEAGVPAADPQRRDALVPGLQRAQLAAPTWPSLKTSAVLDGDEWIINGQKVWTTGGHHADYCFLLTRTDPDAPKHKGISLPARADAPARRRGARHHPARRHGRVLRGVLRPTPAAPRTTSSAASTTAGRSPTRRSAFERGTVGHHRLPALRGGVPADGRGGHRERRHRRPAHPPAPGAVLHEDPDPADQRPALAVGDADGHARTWASPRSARPTRCSGRRCTSGRWSWPSTSTAPTSMLIDTGPSQRLVAGRGARQAPRRLPGQPDDVVVLLLPQRDDLGRHQPDPAQHRRRARPRPARRSPRSRSDGCGSECVAARAAPQCTELRRATRVTTRRFTEHETARMPTRRRRHRSDTVAAHAVDPWDELRDGRRRGAAGGRGGAGARRRASGVEELQARQDAAATRHPHDGHHVHRLLRRREHRPGLAVRRHPAGHRRPASGRRIERGLDAAAAARSTSSSTTSTTTSGSSPTACSRPTCSTTR